MPCCTLRTLLPSIALLYACETPDGLLLPTQPGADVGSAVDLSVSPDAGIDLGAAMTPDIGPSSGPDLGFGPPCAPQTLSTLEQTVDWSTPARLLAHGGNYYWAWQRPTTFQFQDRPPFESTTATGWRIPVGASQPAERLSASGPVTSLASVVADEESVAAAVSGPQIESPDELGFSYRTFNAQVGQVLAQWRSRPDGYELVQAVRAENALLMLQAIREEGEIQTLLLEAWGGRGNLFSLEHSDRGPIRSPVLQIHQGRLFLGFIVEISQSQRDEFVLLEASENRGFWVERTRRADCEPQGFDMTGVDNRLAVAMRCRSQIRLQLFDLDTLEAPLLNALVAPGAPPSSIAFNGAQLAIQTSPGGEPGTELYFFTPMGVPFSQAPYRPNVPTLGQHLSASLTGQNGTWAFIQSRRDGPQTHHIFQQLSGCAQP